MPENNVPDPQFAEVFEHSNGQMFPAGLDILLLRDRAEKRNAEARQALGPPPAGICESDINIPVRGGDSVAAHVYAPSDDNVPTKWPIFVFFHGGGFCIGSHKDDMGSNRCIVLKAHVVVVSIDYRLAPEYPFPQGILDAFDALCWIARNAQAIHSLASVDAGLIVGGTSAGGSIANAVVYLNRDQECPAPVTGQFLSVAPLLPYPAVPIKYQDDYRSVEQNKPFAIPSFEVTQRFIEAYSPDIASPLMVPAIHPKGHAGIPSTYLQVCGLDVLRDEGLIYERILREEGGIATRLDLYPGLPHHFWEFFPQLKGQIEKRNEDTVAGILWLLKNRQNKAN
ncbi:Alpha/Beta hydrolase protein [Pyrenochaeta sp. MPI-SDFR-AT-0127]|nr:Alpha/Beta hydrolase protein [Pyrenochaeta sp. MPI-SDFR-AT-0127]